MKVSTAAAVACAAGFLCSCGQKEAGNSQAAPKPIPMTVQLSPAAVREAGIETTLVASSDVHPSLALTGTLAAKPWTPEEQAALSDAETADAKRKLADANFNRLSRLFKDGITSRQDLDAARAERDQAQAAAVQADAKRANLGLSGISSTLERRAPIWGLANLSDVDLARIRPGAGVEITTAAFPDVRFPGRVADVSRSEDPDTRTFTVRIAIDDSSGRLRPQMLASFAISTPGTLGITVPATAVLLQGDGSWVYLATGSSFRKQRIQTGATTADRVQVTAGLSPGQVVVTRGAQLLESERLKSQLKEADED